MIQPLGAHPPAPKKTASGCKEVASLGMGLLKPIFAAEAGRCFFHEQFPRLAEKRPSPALQKNRGNRHFASWSKGPGRKEEKQPHQQQPPFLTVYWQIPVRQWCVFQPTIGLFVVGPRGFCMRSETRHQSLHWAAVAQAESALNRYRFWVCCCVLLGESWHIPLQHGFHHAPFLPEGSCATYDSGLWASNPRWLWWAVTLRRFQMAEASVPPRPPATCRVVGKASNYIHAHPSIHPSMHTYMHTYIHTCMHTCMHTYLPTCHYIYICFGWSVGMFLGKTHDFPQYHIGELQPSISRGD